MGLRLLGLLLVLAGAAAAGVEAWRAITPTESLLAGPRVVEIPAHEGLVAIARRLADADVVRCPETFVALSILRGNARALRAGEYEFPRGTTTVGALRLFPGISAELVRNALRPPLRGLVLEAYGTGNAPDDDPAVRLQSDPQHAARV